MGRVDRLRLSEPELFLALYLVLAVVFTAPLSIESGSKATVPAQAITPGTDPS